MCSSEHPSFQWVRRSETVASAPKTGLSYTLPSCERRGVFPHPPKSPVSFRGVISVSAGVAFGKHVDLCGTRQVIAAPSFSSTPANLKVGATVNACSKRNTSQTPSPNLNGRPFPDPGRSQLRYEAPWRSRRALLPESGANAPHPSYSRRRTCKRLRSRTAVPQTIRVS